MLERGTFQLVRINYAIRFNHHPRPSIAQQRRNIQISFQRNMREMHISFFYLYSGEFIEIKTFMKLVRMYNLIL